MAEKYYIENLREKVVVLFSELGKANRLNEKTFISVFKEKYADDYNALVADWERKIRAFKKNRKGNPVSYPIRPDKILSNMYRNYYYKLIKKPKIQKAKENYIQKLKCEMGNYGFKIKENPSYKGRYSVIDKSEDKEIATDIQYQELKKVCNELKKKAGSK